MNNAERIAALKARLTNVGRKDGVIEVVGQAYDKAEELLTVSTVNTWQRFTLARLERKCERLGA